MKKDCKSCKRYSRCAAIGYKKMGCDMSKNLFQPIGEFCDCGEAAGATGLCDKCFLSSHECLSAPKKVVRRLGDKIKNCALCTNFLRGTCIDPTCDLQNHYNFSVGQLEVAQEEKNVLPKRREPEPGILAKAISKRALQHTPYGIIPTWIICRPMSGILKGRIPAEHGVIVMLAAIAVAAALLVGFWIYEWVEHIRMKEETGKGDGADRDIFGQLEGMLAVILFYWDVFMV